MTETIERNATPSAVAQQPRLFKDAKVGAGEAAVQGDMLLPANPELENAA